MEEGQVETQPSIEESASSIAQAMLQAEENPQAEPAKEEVKPETEPETPAEEATPETQAEEPSQPERYKLTVKAEDGSDVEVEEDLEGLKKGYMLEKAFRMKTAQLARDKEAVQQKVKEAIEPKLKEYDDKLQLAEQAIWHSLAPEIQSIDWNKLASENPAEWAQKYQYVQNVNARLAQIQQERSKINEARTQETQKSLQKAAQESVEVLQTEIPGWNNDLYGKILKTGIEYGFKPEEVNAITDHRAIKVLWKAMQFDALQKAKPSVEKRTTAPAPKVMKPGTAEKPDANADKWNQGMAKLRKTGNTDDAIEVAKLMIARENRR